MQLAEHMQASAGPAGNTDGTINTMTTHRLQQLRDPVTNLQPTLKTGVSLQAGQCLPDTKEIGRWPG